MVYQLQSKRSVLINFKKLVQILAVLIFKKDYAWFVLRVKKKSLKYVLL